MVMESSGGTLDLALRSLCLLLFTVMQVMCLLGLDSSVRVLQSSFFL